MKTKSSNIDSVLKSLDESKKELDCLYRIDEELKDIDADLCNVLSELTKIIPDGWRFSEVCKVKINVYNIEAETDGFKKTELKLSSELSIDQKTVGEIILCYAKPVNAEKEIFLNEENRLFQTIVSKLNQYLSYRKLKKTYSENVENKFKTSNAEHDFIDYLSDLHLTKEEIAVITEVQIDFKKGETICKQGTFASFIMILKTGLVKATIENSHYKSHVFKITTPFSIIGLSSMYNDKYYHFSCHALEPSKLYLIEYGNFIKIIQANSKFSFEIMKMYSKSLQDVYDRLGSIANKRALGKVCDSLIYLCERVFHSHIIETTITRKEIAEFSGLATENLVRILSDLKRDNIIEINNKSIKILNFDNLKTLSSLG